MVKMCFNIPPDPITHQPTKHEKKSNIFIVGSNQLTILQPPTTKKNVGLRDPTFR